MSTTLITVDQPRERSKLACWATFFAVWGPIGFVTGSMTLLGPVRWFTERARSAEWGDGVENVGVMAIIGLFVVGSALLSWVITRRLGSSGMHATVATLVCLVLVTGATMWLWMTPAVMIGLQTTQVSEVSRFTFGPYPDADRLATLRDEGYTGVISLLHPAVVPFEPKLLADERAAIAEAGLELIHTPMLPWVSDNVDSLAKIKSLATSGTGRYYVHCYLGRDRVGVVRNLVERITKQAQTDTAETAYSLGKKEAFERGPIVELEPGVFVTPFPTDEELFAFYLAGELEHVVSLLDPDNPEDRPWIEKEEQALADFEVPYSALPVSWQRYDPQVVLAAARRVKQLPRPLAVHAFLPNSTATQAFQLAYESDLPPLPPELFREPMGGGQVELIGANVATGPRPDGPEFGTYLHRRGVRGIVYLGERRADTDVDREIARSVPLEWQAFEEYSTELVGTLAQGGPWYVYGPALEGLQARIAQALREGPQRQAQASTVAPAPGVAHALSAGSLLMGFMTDPAATYAAVVPSVGVLAALSVAFLFYGLFAATLAGWLRVTKGVKTSYTRKIFHFLIFTMAGAIQLTLGLPSVMLFGIVITSCVMFAVWRGDGFAFYESMARDSDRPRRSLFILVPMVTTAAGGLLSNLLFPQFAFIGYLVCGWGDALGEPVGARWGRHDYRVPSLAGVPAHRTLEGSLAVFTGGSVAAMAGLLAFGMPAITALMGGLACGLFGAAVEAFSNHGLDNFTIQVASSAAAFLLLA